MTIKQLMQLLSEFPPDLEVMVPTGTDFKLANVLSIERMAAIDHGYWHKSSNPKAITVKKCLVIQP